MLTTVDKYPLPPVNALFAGGFPVLPVEKPVDNVENLC